MQILDEMSANETIALYYEMHHAIREGNLTKLLELKSKCPELFNEIKDAEIRDMIAFAKEFQQTDRYKELSRQLVKEKMTIINNDSLDK